MFYMGQQLGIRKLSAAILTPTLSLALVSCAEASPAGPAGASSSSSSPSSSPEGSPADSTVERLGVEIVATHPADPTSFTQGLEVEPGGTLLVGTGRNGQSRIYRTTTSGQVSDEHQLEPTFFGEGLTRYDDVVWQLTWKSGVAFRRDADTLAELDRVNYTGEGWGLCSRDGELIMSDGTDKLRRLDPQTFAERERFPVTLQGRPVAGINELECVGDEIYANIFTRTDIVRIDARTGEVTGVIDASAVPDNGPADDPDAVLNGIAHIPGTDRFYLTGKLWPDLYEVRFVPQQ